MLNNKIDENDSIFTNQKALNYKGIYFEEDSDQRYFEGGAHFAHMNLCQKLEEIIITLSPDRRGYSIYNTPNISNSYDKIVNF